MLWLMRYLGWESKESNISLGGRNVRSQVRGCYDLESYLFGCESQ